MAQQQYLCLDRRYAASEVTQSVDQLPYGPYSYWIDPAQYVNSYIFFMRLVTNNPADDNAIANLTYHSQDYNVKYLIPYTFTAPNIIVINIVYLLQGQIDIGKTIIITQNIPSNGSDRKHYPIEIAKAVINANIITFTLATPRVFPVTKALSTTWTVSQNKYRSDSIFIDKKKIKKIKLLDFMFCNWLTTYMPTTSTRLTLLINEYTTNAFQSATGNYHYIFNTDRTLITPNSSGPMMVPMTLAHLEGNIYPVDNSRQYVNDNIAEFVFEPPVDVKDTLTLTLGVMGMPIGLYDQTLHISRMQFFVGLIDWNSTFQVWIQGNEVLRQFHNNLIQGGLPYFYCYITIAELITTELEADAVAITYATSPNGFIMYSKSIIPWFGSRMPVDPAGYCSPFGYMVSLLQKQGEEYPTYPPHELMGKIVKCTAFMQILNYRCELVIE